MIAVSAKDPVLSRDEIHVWSATLELGSGDMVHLQATLSPDERDRASRFRFLKDQRQFIAAHGLLRHILSLYIHWEPAGFQFCCSACGKPQLRSESSREMQDLCLNYSHSHSVAVFAFARNRKVGIDVEFIQAHIADELIADRFLTRNEACALRAVPASLRTKAFLNCWTRKEAYVKARGEGFRISLDSFEVFPDPGGPVVITDNEGSKWSLESFAPAPGYAAALAAEGQGWHTRFHCIEKSSCELNTNSRFASSSIGGDI